MPIGRRLPLLLLVLVLAGTPALALRAACIGRSCDAVSTANAPAVPFCSLSRELRRSIVAGSREGRSPDVMAATIGTDRVRTEVVGGLGVAWPGSEAGRPPDMRVPIAFLGGGIERATLQPGTRLDAIAPTLEPLTGLRRSHPEVRTGAAAGGVIAPGSSTPLIVLVAWKGIGTRELEAAPGAWRFLRRAVRTGTGTIDGDPVSLPLDPAATLTTIGTGAVPSAHGITGARIRDEEGAVRRAWSGPGTGSVIASLADDLDRSADDEPVVGAVLADASDRGIVGDGWYLDALDRDDVRVVGGAPAATVTAALELLRSGAGRDDVTDLLGVVLDGTVAQDDDATAQLVGAVRATVPGATFVIAGTGSSAGPLALDAADLAADVDRALAAPVVDATAAGGFFLDRDVLVERSLTAQRVADALAEATAPGGSPIVEDVYPSFAVEFARYC